jgi:hypothetical protein
MKTEITAMERMGLLVDISVSMEKYTNAGSNWRPSIQDYCTFHTLVNMYEDDMSEEQPELIWKITPDEVMYHIIENNDGFTIDHGWEDLYDSLREYLNDKDFTVSVDELTEEEDN